MEKRWLLIAPALMLLAGCSEGYRYPCQDPENWSEKICQKPYCSANGTCPEDLTHYEKQTPGATRMPSQETPMSKKGDGKC